MEELLFELLKVRLQRNIHLLEGFQHNSEEIHRAKRISATCALLENWMRESEDAKTALEEAHSNLAEMVELHEKMRHSWRWKLGHKVIGFLEAFSFKGKSCINAYTRMDDLLLKVKSSLKDKAIPVNPFRFSASSSQFLEPVDFPIVREPKKDKVAIIVLNRNGKEHLEKFFSSFLAFNTYGDYEFIIIDHDSSDVSREIIASFTQKLHIRLIPFSSNLTFSYSNNYAAGQTNAEFLFFLNNDIIFDQDVIGSMVALINQYPEAGIIAPALYYPDDHFHRSGTIQHSGISFIYKQKRDDHIRYAKTDPPSFHVLNYKYSHLFRDAIIPVNSQEPGSGVSFHPAICAAAMLCRRDDFYLAGGFDENYIYGYEDVDISLVFQKKLGKKLVLANDLGMIHNESYTRKKEGFYKSSLKIHNLLMLTNRFGYYIRINYLKDLFCGKRFWTDMVPIMAIISENDIPEDGETTDKLKFLSALFTQRLKWEVRVISSSEQDMEITNADIAVYLDSNPPVGRFPGAKDTLICVKWPEENNPDFSDPDAFLELIMDRIENHLNIAVKLPVEAGDTVEGLKSSLLMQSVRELLADDRCTVRTDLPGKWYDYGTFSDQVVISFPGEHKYYPQPGQINVLWVMPDSRLVDLSMTDFYDLIFIEEGVIKHPLFETEGYFSKKIIRTNLFANLWAVHREKSGI
jgi:GT2 family glycosyltransferase